MKQFFEQWGCLTLIAAAVAFFFFANADSKNKAPEKAVPTPSVHAPLAPTFGGYSCAEDCSGHEAGYQWAEEQGISNPDDCGGDSVSFEEGCRAYAEEQAQYEDEGYVDY